MATSKGKKASAKAVAQTEDTDAGYDNLSKISWGHIGKEKMLPEGTYKLAVRGVKRMPATEKASQQLLVFFKALEPLLISADGDVDDELFAELGDDYDISVNSVKGQFWLGEARDFAAVDELFEKCGIDTEELREADTDFDESLKMLKGREVYAYVKVDTYNPDRPQLKATSYSKVE